MKKSIYSEYGKGELQCSPELSNIANYLLLGSSYINDVSLFHGKAGAMLALYSFSEKYHKPIFHEYADDLMQDIYKMVHDNLPIGIEQGLAGIGYAFTLLSNSDIIECDLNDVLYTIDHTIMCHDCRRMTDYTVKTGLFGVWLYICERMKSRQPITTFDNVYVNELNMVLKGQNGILKYNPAWLLNELKTPKYDSSEYLNKELGIDNGCAYFLIKDSFYEVFCHQ